MKSRMCYVSRPSCRRSAFTLVELLTVIAIIGILTGLAVVGVFAVIANQKGRNTKATIIVVNKLLQDRWSSVIADAKKETLSPVFVTLWGGDPERARVIWIKLRLCEAFPIAYKEVNPADPTTIVNQYIVPYAPIKPHFVKYRNTVPSIYPKDPGPTESSACLLLALKTLDAGGVAIDDQLKNAMVDTNGDGLPELIDGWSTPLAFFRFPWNNTDLQASNPGAADPRKAKYADPIDTGGTLINNSWYASTARTTFEAALHPVRTSAGNAYYVTPVIASAGPDQRFGLNAYSDSNSLDPTKDPAGLLQEMSINVNVNDNNKLDKRLNQSQYSTDNIYSYKLR